MYRYMYVYVYTCIYIPMAELGRACEVHEKQRDVQREHAERHGTRWVVTWPQSEKWLV